ncbi:MAG: Cof-type HAD-IIB family hydrolase [Limnochordia bacterium]|nr:Cof-type HAD-IIB family hydrolase [Limnochordia bacterium]
MLDPRLYAFDIDGTLLTTDYKILPSTIEAMTLLAKGKLRAPIMLASARSPRAIDPIARELNLAPLYVSLNGAFIVQDRRVLYEKPMGKEAAQAVVAIGQEAGLSVNVYSGWNWFIDASNPWSTHEANMVSWQPEIRDLRRVDTAHKVLFMGDQDAILKAQRRLNRDVRSVAAHLSIPHYLEIVDAGASKAKGLEIVGELLQIDFRHMVAFGDGENDLAMLKRAGFSVAMGNAHPSLKEQADLVTSSNDQDGVFQAVLKIMELGGASR